MTTSDWNSGNAYAMFTSELSTLSFPSLDNTLLGGINIEIQCNVAQ